jgi:hypothetical protein
MNASIDFDATLITGSEPGAWTYAIVPDSAPAGQSKSAAR